MRNGRRGLQCVTWKKRHFKLKLNRSAEKKKNNSRMFRFVYFSLERMGKTPTNQPTHKNAIHFKVIVVIWFTVCHIFLILHFFWLSVQWYEWLWKTNGIFFNRKLDVNRCLFSLEGRVSNEKAVTRKGSHFCDLTYKLYLCYEQNVQPVDYYN